MKKLMFLAVLLLTVSFVKAQLNFGVKFGYNSSLSFKNINSVPSGNYDMKNIQTDFSNGFQLGVFARAGEKLYFQPELLYEMGKRENGVTLNDVDNSAFSYDKLTTVSTIDIPLLVGYKISESQLFNFRAFAGPKLRLDAGSKLHYENLSSGSSITISDLEGEVKKAQIGLEAGLGIDFYMLTLDARFNLIGDMYETKIKNVDIDHVSNSTFVISLGWKFF